MKTVCHLSKLDTLDNIEVISKRNSLNGSERNGHLVPELLVQCLHGIPNDYFQLREFFAALAQFVAETVGRRLPLVKHVGQVFGVEILWSLWK